MCRPPSPARLLATVSIALALAVVTVDRAQGTFLFWDDPAGGSASVANNWNPQQVPVSSDECFYELNNTFSVTWSSTVNNIQKHWISNGTVTFVVTSPHTVDDFIDVSGAVATPPTLRLTSGDITIVGGGIGAGNGGGSGGTFRLEGVNAVVHAGGMNIGQSGDGLVEILNGGQFLPEGTSTHTNLALDSGGEGTLNVSGIGAGNQRSYFETPSAGNLVVGRFGSGFLNVTAGGSVHVSGGLNIASGTNGSGTVVVSGSVANPSDLFVEATLDLGSNPSGVDAGTALLHVQSGGIVTVDNPLFVGDPSLTNASLRVDEGGTLIANDVIYNDETSFFDFRGGRIRIDGPSGDFDPPGTALILNSTVGNPTLELADGTEMTLTQTTSPFRALQVGTNGQGTLRLLNGSTTTLTAGEFFIGLSPTGEGFLTIDGGSSLTANDFVYCGQNGVATVGISGGGTLSAPDVQMSVTSDASSTVAVDDGGSLLSIGNSLRIGGHSAGAGGPAVLSISNGALTEVLGAGTNTTIWNGTGELHLDPGGVFTSSGIVDHRGAITIGGGILNASTLDFNGAATLLGTGLVNARIQADDATCTMTASGGPLTLGVAGQPLGFASQGTLHVGSQLTTLLDSNGPLLGNVTLAGGTLTYVSTATLSAGKTLSGNGTVDGNVANAGVITASGSGLSFGGLVTGVGQGVSGTLVRFLAGGGFTGAGTLNCRVDGDANSTITATGNLTLGSAASTTGVVLDGTLFVGAGTVTLRDLDGVDLGALTEYSGGNLTHIDAITTSSGDRVTGIGRLTAPLFKHGGFLATGASPGGFTVVGDYSQQATGILEIELGDHGSNERDQLRITGDATFGGTLRLVALPTFDVHVGDEYVIGTYASRSGAFSSVTLIGFEAGTAFDVIYDPTELIVRVTADPTGVESVELPVLPETFALSGRPSSNRSVEVRLGLPTAADVRMDLYNVSGRQMLRVFDGPLPAGWQTRAFEAHDLAAGVYFLRAEFAGERRRELRTSRLVIVR